MHIPWGLQSQTIAPVNHTKILANGLKDRLSPIYSHLDVAQAYKESSAFTHGITAFSNRSLSYIKFTDVNLPTVLNNNSQKSADFMAARFCSVISSTFEVSI